MGFAAISPVVGLYEVVFVGTVVAGPAWVWVLPSALTEQCLLLAVVPAWAAPILLATIAVVGLMHLVVARPQRALTSD